MGHLDFAPQQFRKLLGDLRAQLEPLSGLFPDDLRPDLLEAPAAVEACISNIPVGRIPELARALGAAATDFGHAIEASARGELSERQIRDACTRWIEACEKVRPG